MEFWIFDVSYRFLMKVARHVQSTKKGSLLNFSNILRKSIATASVFYCDAKHSDTLLLSIHVSCYLFLNGCDQKWALFSGHGTLKSAVSQESELIK